MKKAAFILALAMLLGVAAGCGQSAGEASVQSVSMICGLGSAGMTDRFAGVAIARAIVGRPKLLLADEPTGALDSASGAQVMDLFQQLHQSGSTIIMITHDQGIAQHAHTSMNIRDGVLSGGAFQE